jgi:citrate synthase
MTESAYSPGLEGVIAGVSAISRIDPERNVLTYRGYNIQDLVDNGGFEESAYLVLHGELPSAAQLADFAGWLQSEREVPPVVYEILGRIPPESSPMDWIKIGISTLGLIDRSTKSENERVANLGRAVRLTAKLPALIANGWRITQGLEPAKSSEAGSHAAHFLRLLTTEEPDQESVSVLNATLILYMEHGFNASTFAARVTVSTLSDLYSGVVSAVGTLKGPLHGGANEEVMRMLLEIGEPENTEAWLSRKLAKTPENPRPRIMGFGHREYKRGDQRAQIIKKRFLELSRSRSDMRWADISQILEKIMMEEKGLYPNLDFPVSPAYYLLGLPIPLYTPVFVVSRVVGWCAHIIEQLDNNRLFRPTNIYNGPAARPYVPLTERS